jgi:hypothetical protein
MDVKLIRKGLLIAVALVVVLLIYAYFSSGAPGVLDASNSDDLSAQFDALNPDIPGTNGGNPGSSDDDTDDSDDNVANS